MWLAQKKMGNRGGKEDPPPKAPNGHELLMATNFLRMTKNTTFPSIKKKTNPERRKTLMRQYIDIVVTKAASEGDCSCCYFYIRR